MAVVFSQLVFHYDINHFVLIRIPAAISEPTTFKHIPYIRIGSNKTDLRLHRQLLKQIYNSGEDWSSKTIDSANIFDLDPTAIKLARQKFIEKHKNTNFEKEIATWDDFTFLNKAKITIDSKITRTAILLLGKPESSHFLLPALSQITWKLETDPGKKKFLKIFPGHRGNSSPQIYNYISSPKTHLA